MKRLLVLSGGTARDDLYEEVEDIISASDFIEKTDGAQLLVRENAHHASERTRSCWSES